MDAQESVATPPKPSKTRRASNYLSVVGLVGIWLWVFSLAWRIDASDLWANLRHSPDTVRAWIEALASFPTDHPAVMLRLDVIVLLAFVALLWHNERSQVPATREMYGSRPIVYKRDQMQVIAELVGEATVTSQEYSQTVLALLADMIVTPETYRHRVTENVDLQREITRRAVTLDIVIDLRQFQPPPGPRLRRRAPQNDTNILVPLVQPDKGRLFDRMELQSPAGSDVMSLAYGSRSTPAYVAALMHQFRMAFDLKPDFDGWDTEDKTLFLDMVAIVSQSAIGLRRKAAQIAEKEGRVIDDARAAARYNAKAVAYYREGLHSRLHARGQICRKRKDAALTKLVQMAKTGVDHYIVIVRCGLAGHLQLKYTYERATASLQQHATPAESTWAPRSLKRLLGIPSNYLVIALTRASHAQSYHMHVRTPEGSFIGPAHIHGTDKRPGDDESSPDGGDSERNAELEGRVVSVKPDPDTLSTGMPYLRPVAKSASNLHVYGRNLSKLSLRLSLRARISERPTGTELFAMIVSWSLLLVTVVLMLTAGSGPTQSDITAATIALPASLAALAIFFVGAFKRALTPSTAGFWLTIGATMLAVYNMVYYAIEVSRIGGRKTPTHGWTYFWYFSLATAVVLVIASTATFLIRYRNFTRSVTGQDRT